MKHDRVDTHLKYSKCKVLAIKSTEKWSTYTHPSQYVNQNMRQCYGIKTYTDNKVLANRPHIISKNENEKTSVLIDVAIPTD
jgi:hypothetical protein